MIIFDPLGLAALGRGIVLARVVFARIEKLTVRISDPKASARLPSHVDTERLLSLVFATEWALLTIFVFADRLPGELQRFVRIACVSAVVALLIFHVMCVIRLKRLGIFDPHDEQYRPGLGGQKRAHPRSRRRARD